MEGKLLMTLKNGFQFSDVMKTSCITNHLVTGSTNTDLIHQSKYFFFQNADAT